MKSSPDAAGRGIDLSVVLLNFNTRDLTLKAIETVKASHLDGYRAEIILCDNASTDGIAAEIGKSHPDVTFIENGGNIGFARGNNPGIRAANGRYVLLLNTDTEVAPETLSFMIRFMDGHPGIGAATCKLVLTDGTIDPACHRGFPTPWRALTYFSGLERLFPRSKLFAGYHLGDRQGDTAHEVDCISGAFFMVPRSVVAEVGLMDEDYFMYGEDVDWAYRIKEKGYGIWYVPDVTTLHKKKQSGRANPDRKRRVATQTHFISTMRQFYQKHYTDKYPWIVTRLVYGAIGLRLFVLRTAGR